MQRTILAPAIVPGAALDELKDWLAITTPDHDGALTALLANALAMAEAFTGSMMLAATCEEMLPASGGWQRLSTRPVQAILAVERAPASGPRMALATSDYAIDLDADGGGRVQLVQGAGAGRVIVRFVAGLAAEWSALPAPIRQGAIRLAAHHWHEREAGDDSAPPAAIAALWHPWRRMRLA